MNENNQNNTNIYEEAGETIYGEKSETQGEKSQNTGNQDGYRNQNYHSQGYGNAYGNGYRRGENVKRLYRSRENRMLCGVCAGVANYFQCDPTIIRLLVVFLTFCSFGSALLAYFVMAVIIPFNE